MADVKIAADWKQLLADEFGKDYFQKLTKFVRAEYAQYAVYPRGSRIFAAFEETPFDKVKVVILGQDPYHGPNQANGLAFAVNPGVTLPPSLINIFKELNADLGLSRQPKDFEGDLKRWAEQGVLLLNATLTVRAKTPGSHQNKGWEDFTDAVIKLLSERKDHLVFILWGAYAQKKGSIIDRNKHLVIESPHPSPFSADRGFFGSKPFSRTNKYLQQHSLQAINWI